jgi:hypothetical protein
MLIKYGIAASKLINHYRLDEYASNPWAALFDSENESKVALWGLNATQLTGGESVPASSRYQISS